MIIGCPRNLDTRQAAYTYDPSNRRTSSTTASGTVYFHYDGSSGDVIAETNAAGKVICQYVRDGGGRLVAVERFDDTSESCFTNQRGDVVGHWTNSGTPSETVRFDPWGNVVSGGVSTSVPYGFAGCRYDRETGLYYMWNRYYDPVTHRFLTKDLYPGETTNPATMNPYLYCLGDPVNAVDPSGLLTFASGGNAVLSVVIGGGALFFGVVGDDQGNVGFMLSGGVHGGLAAGYSASVQYQATNAPNIYALRRASGYGGGGGSAGVGGPTVGFERVSGKASCGEYKGANVQLGWGKSVFPAEAHVGGSYSLVAGVNLSRPVDAIMSFFMDDVSARLVARPPVSAGDPLRSVER